MMAFITPLRHPDASKNWANVIARLRETMASLNAACIHGGKAFGVLVANKEAELPPLPESIHVLRVDQPPPAVSVYRGESSFAERREAVWADKGGKLAAGAIFARDQGAQYIMIVDADDLVHREIPSLVDSMGGPGWYINRGILLPVGSRTGAVLKDFHNWCGSSVIVNVDLLGLQQTPEAMDQNVVKRWLGHHRVMIPELKKAGHELRPIPFLGAIYRTGHGDGSYQRKGLRQELFTFSHFRRSPAKFLGRLLGLRRFTLEDQVVFLGGTKPE